MSLTRRFGHLILADASAEIEACVGGTRSWKRKAEDIKMDAGVEAEACLEKALADAVAVLTKARKDAPEIMEIAKRDLRRIRKVRNELRDQDSLLISDRRHVEKKTKQFRHSIPLRERRKGRRN